MFMHVRTEYERKIVWFPSPFSIIFLYHFGSLVSD